MATLEQMETLTKNLRPVLKEYEEDVVKDILAQIYQIFDNHNETISDEVIVQVNKIKPSWRKE